MINKEIKPLCTAITVPPLVGMIAFGCIARNFFGDYVMNNYPDYWADWIRQICLSIILMRGGLELEFKGIGQIVVLLTLCPQIVEAGAVAAISRYLFDLPWSLCFANGFCLGAVSPAVLVPSIMILISLKRGTKKGIPMIMLAASSFDDIIAITVFSIFVSVAFESIEKVKVEGSTSQAAPLAPQSPTVKTMIGMNIFYIVTGIVFGVLLGYIMKCFNKCRCCSLAAKSWSKFFLMLAIAIALPIVTYYIEFEESKYIAIIFFGYTCFQVWGEEKPDKKLASFWKVCQPFLFSSIGASVLFKNISGDTFGKSFGLIVVGLILRWIATYLASGG